MLAYVVARAGVKKRTSRAAGSIIKFLKPALAGGSATIPTSTSDVPVPKKMLQAVSLVLFSCFLNSPAVRIGSPVTKGLVSICDDWMMYSSKDPIDQFMIPSYRAVYSLYCTAMSSAETESVALDGWSGALGTPVLAVTWHFMDDAWRLNTVPTSTLHTGALSKTSDQLRAILDAVMKNSAIVGSEALRIHAVTSDNEDAMARCVDLLTNFVN